MRRAAIALVILLARPLPSHADASLPPAAKSFIAGPFPSIAAYCAQYRFHFTDGTPPEPPTICLEEGPGALPETGPLVTAAGHGPIKRATLIRAGISVGSYNLAVETPRGLYVHEETDLFYDGRGRHAHQIQQLDVQQTPAGPLVILRATTAWWHNTLDDPNAEEWYRTGTLILCGVTKSNALACTKPLPMATATTKCANPQNEEGVPVDAWACPDWELALAFQARTFTLRRKPGSLFRPRRSSRHLTSGVEMFLKRARTAAGTHPMPHMSVSPQ